MNREELNAYIKNLDQSIEGIEDKTQFPTFVLPAKNWRTLALKLRNDEPLQFDFLYCLSGVDWPEFMWVVYHLRSTKTGISIIVKARIDDREKSHY